MSTEEKSALTAEHLDAINARPWLSELTRNFRQGLDVAGFTAITLDAVVEQTMANEAIATQAAVQNVLEKLRPHLPPNFKATFPNADELASNPEIKKQREESFRLRLADAETHWHTGRIWLFIRQTGILRAWGSLEALAEDLWTQALNNAGKQFRQQAFQRIANTPTPGNEVAGLGKKQIDLWFLALHDFNLVGSLGTILVEKFTFGKVDGMEEAFKAAFGWHKKNPAPAFPDADGLRAVEAKRHVIAHRGGIIDAEYATKAKVDVSEIGKPLQLSAEDVVSDIGVITTQGAQLLGQTAIWLNEVDPIV